MRVGTAGWVALWVLAALWAVSTVTVGGFLVHLLWEGRRVRGGGVLPGRRSEVRRLLAVQRRSLQESAAARRQYVEALERNQLAAAVDAVTVYTEIDAVAQLRGEEILRRQQT